MKLASFNIDIDPVDCYYSIHGIRTVSSSYDPVWSKGVVRFLELLDRHNIKATFFITAADFVESNTEIMRKIVENGHEIGNHTYSHDYKFTLMSIKSIRDEIRMNHQFIKERTGVDCVGFRSPGYNISPSIIKVLKEEGYSYDTSFFPSPVYYLAKWLLINLKKLKGRESGSIIYSFTDCFGKKNPYPAGESIKKEEKKSKLLELPITTVTFAGFPLIGTSAVVFSEFIFKIMLQLSLKMNFINFETHGIDLCQIKDSEKLSVLKKFQPDLRYPLKRKISRFEKLIEFYKANGYEFKTLKEITEINIFGV